MNNTNIEPTQVKTLNNNSEWLKYLVSNELMTKEFVISLCAELEENKEFTELIMDIQKLSSSLVTNSQLSKVSCYENLRQTNDEIAKKMSMVEQILTNQILLEVNNPHKLEKHLHAGFVNYLYYAWTNEMGVCIRPDMIYYVIVSETMEYIIKNKKNLTNYEKLFASEISNTAQNNKLVFTRDKNDKVELTNDELFETIKSTFKNEEFRKHIIDVNFASQPNNFNVALQMIFNKKISEHTINTKPMCGINTVEIIGNEYEWTTLLDTIAKLSIYIPELGDYYVNCTDTINKFVLELHHLKSKNIYDLNNMTEYLSKIFWIEHDYNSSTDCSTNSGNSMILKGWFSHFYINKYECLESYPCHSNYIPYTIEIKQSVDSPDTQCESTYKNFIKVCGMNYSILEDNTLYPLYSESLYEVRHDKIFQLLKI